MTFKIDPAIFEKYPGLVVGAVTVRGIDNRGKSEDVMKFLREQEDSCGERFGDVPVTEHAHIACWREVYRSFGAKPKKYPSSIEAITRRVLKGGELPHINKLVDIYNALSLKYFLTAGGEDEGPVLCLGDPEEKVPEPGEVIYKDDLGTICRRWNWREADRTKLTEDTTDAILVFECIPPVERSVLESAVEELVEWRLRWRFWSS